MDPMRQGADRVPGVHRAGALLLAVVSIVGASAVVVVVPARAASASAEKWDPRIAPIAAEVEKLRELKFDHPVPVDFLGEKAFQKTVRIDESKLSTKQRDQVATSAGQLSAVGLVDHGVNLARSTNALQSTDVLAYYSPVTKRVTVKGKKLDVATRVTLAHELTHALQDQHFDLQRLDRAAAKSQSSSALRALVEGDAVRVQNAYLMQLPASDQTAYAQQQGSVSSGVQAAVADKNVPLALEALFEAPYAFGPVMLDVVISQRNEEGVDALFRKPPTTDAAFLTPTTLLDGSKVQSVAAPKVNGPQEKQVGKPDTFGAFALYLVLALHDDPASALRVADGWGGDRFVTYKSAGATCVRASFVGRTRDDTVAIGSALARWAALMPAGSATVETTGSPITFSSCDVATPRPAPTHSAEDAVVFAASRDELVSVIAKQGLTLAVASCTADAVVGDPSLLSLLETASTTTPDPATLTNLRGRVTSAVGECAARAAT
jgi:hypothetical protein